MGRLVNFLLYSRPQVTINRRQFVLGAAALGMAHGETPHPYSAEMPNMLLAYLERKLDEQNRRWSAQRAKIPSAADTRVRHQFVRAKLREMAGPFPSKSPLAAHTTRVIERKGYRIETVLFQSQPDYWVPANLYLPAGAKSPVPGIVMQRGHFDAERMSPDYQQLYVDLAASGFAVLSYDSIGQGERRQYYAPRDEVFEELLSPTLEHCAIGGLLMLIGESAAGWFAGDGMRAIDYLLGRKEVDGTRIGCADHTDTGWSTLYQCALDERIQCASIHAHGPGRRWPIDRNTWNTTDDPEQWLFPAANYGIDLIDVMASLAPRPLQVLVEDQSGEFDPAASTLAGNYRQMDSSAKFAVEKARIGEDWPKAHRLATVHWFRRWLQNEEGSVAEFEITPQRYSALSASPNGSLRESKLGKSIYSIIAERAQHMPPLRTPSGSGIARLKEDIRELVVLSGKPVPLGPRELSSDRLEGYWLSQVEFLSEPGIYVSTELYRAAHPNGVCVVYVEGDVTTLAADDDDDLGERAHPDDNDRKSAGEFAHALARKGYNVVVADVRGLGATRPPVSRRDLRGPWEHLHGSDVALANMAWSLGDSLLAMRVRDLMRTSEYAAQFGKVHLVGVEMGAAWALFAGALDAKIAGVTIQRGLASYRMLAEHGRYHQAASQFVPGLLKQFDLPQVAGAIAPRPLTILNPANHLKMPLAADAAERAYSWTRVAYTTANAGEAFKLAFGEDVEEHLDRA